jgi:cytochrome oxidase Cu insertion factor (SCO1/SenC/PrrC family)
MSDPSSEDRAAKFSQNTPWIPRKAVVVAVVAFVVLGLGGVVFDHFFGGPVSSSTAVTAGTNPPPLETTVPRPAATTRPTSTTQPSEPVVADVPAPLVSLMGLTELRAAPAPGFALDTTGGSTVSLSSLRGKVVIVSFFDSACNDICPVLAAELRQSDVDLGADASRVVMLTVNTDPDATSPASATPAEISTDLRSVPEWHFLTGTLKQLDAVWKAYGVSIEVQTSTGLVSHNDVLDFVDPEGRLRFHATPFGNEASNGSFSLPSRTKEQFASGVADTARSLLGKDES